MEEQKSTTKENAPSQSDLEQGVRCAACPAVLEYKKLLDGQNGAEFIKECKLAAELNIVYIRARRVVYEMEKIQSWGADELTKKLGQLQAAVYDKEESNYEVLYGREMPDNLKRRAFPNVEST
jgi:hypothetical protein